MVVSEAIPDGNVPRPSSGDLAAEDLSYELKNVGLNEVVKKQIETMMSVTESNGAVDGNHEEEGDSYGGYESESENMVEKRDVVYPVRPGAEDCSFYLRNGSCKFGSICKFNHPPSRKIQISKDKVREKEEDADTLGLIDCKYYFRTGSCKYGETCRFNHTKPKTFQASPELNFLGLPIRLEETKCPYYMSTGTCKFGAECKFNHPGPTTIGGFTGSYSPEPTFQASSPSWNSPRHVNGTTPYIPTMLSQTHGVPSQTRELNGYQASMYSLERSVFSPSTTYLMNNSSAETSAFSQYQHQKPAEEFPERPNQPECSYYLKTGDCKFKFTCKFHHPKNRLPKQPPYALNEKGLPLRPDQNICTHYSRYGICKFGPACRFDHSIQLSFSTGSSQAVVEPPQVGRNGHECDGWN